MKIESARVFVINYKKYEAFIIVETISFKFKRTSFTLKKRILNGNQDIIKGLMYIVHFINAEDRFLIIDFYLPELISITGITPDRLFALQSLASIADKISKNIDNVIKIASLFLKMQSICWEEDWFNLYLYSEFKLLLMFDDHNTLGLKGKENRFFKNNVLQHYDKEINKAISNKVVSLEVMSNLWNKVNHNFLIPNERKFFYKLMMLDIKI